MNLSMIFVIAVVNLLFWFCAIGAASGAEWVFPVFQVALASWFVWVAFVVLLPQMERVLRSDEE